MSLIRLIPLFLAYGILCGALQAASLAAGPMLGYPEMREVSVWVQTDGPAEVQLRYWPLTQPEQPTPSSSARTRAESAFAHTFRLGPLPAGTFFGYALSIDGQNVPLPGDPVFQTAPDFREKFPPPDFAVAVGAGHYVNDRAYDPLNRIPGSGYEIFESIRSLKPDLMLWLGNTVHVRPADAGSRSGIHERYRLARAHPDLQALLSSVHHAALWGQGEIGPEPRDARDPELQWASEAFRHYWPNRSFGWPEEPRAQNGVLRYSDVEFFFLDAFTFRDVSERFASRRQVYGAAQLDWLLDGLQRSQATFKVICTGAPMISPAEEPDNFTVAPDERNDFLEDLAKREIDGVVFLAGGKPFGEMTKMVRSSGYDLWELTVGPMTARPVERNREINYFRQPGTSSYQRHFALLSFSGPEADRQIEVSVRDTHGNELWSHKLRATNLSFSTNR